MMLNVMKYDALRDESNPDVAKVTRNVTKRDVVCNEM
jgi:hypothetical protein